jgi:hypothetical protein
MKVAGWLKEEWKSCYQTIFKLVGQQASGNKGTVIDCSETEHGLRGKVQAKGVKTHIHATNR